LILAVRRRHEVCAGRGLTDERRQFREGIRMTAAERFAQGEPSSVIAKELRVSVRSVQRWRRAWDKAGPRALRSAGAASLPRLSEAQFAVLEAELAKGPVAHGWPDQRWTLSRIKTGDRAALPQELHRCKECASC
jgi:transposase